MTRQNNKGFSLIDVVIAVAILSILLAPILRQIVQTHKTSAQSKERQYVLDNAEYVMNYFQSVNMRDLATKTDAINMNENNVKVSYSYTEDLDPSDSDDDTKFDCTLYDEEGNSTGVTLTYNVKVYQLEDAKLGRDDNEYDRKVVISDLANKIMAQEDPLDSSKSYRVNYSVADAKKANLETKGFVEMNDGSFVKYTTKSFDGHNFDLISAIVVKNKANDNYIDPNEQPIGSIQDLDKDKVALIQGSASDFDKAAESDFFAAMMTNYKTVNTAGYQNAIENPNFSFSGMVGDARPEKYTVVSVTKSPTKDEDNNLDYYLVQCGVYYTYTYSLGTSETFTSKLYYPVYSRRFFTKTAPDVYLIYEPFVTNSSVEPGQFMYATKDFIVTYNDANTDGSDGKHASKLYLYRPDLDQLHVDYQNVGASVFNGTRTMMKDERVFYTPVGNSNYDAVDIHIIQAKSGSANPMHVVTNITCNETAGNKFMSLTPKRYYDATKDDIDHVVQSTLSGKALESAGNVFSVTSDANELANAKQAVKQLGFAGADCAVYTGNPGDGIYSDENAATPDLIYMVPDDTDETGRLYTVTLTLTNKEDGSVTMYTGSKGADH